MRLRQAGSLILATFSAAEKNPLMLAFPQAYFAFFCYILKKSRMILNNNRQPNIPTIS